MLEVKVDSLKNFIFIKMEGFMHDDDMKMAAEKVISEAKKLKTNYTVITDVTKFKPSSQNGAMEIQKAQKFLLDNGASKFIRIVESVLGKMQFTKNAKEVGLQVIEVRTYEDALTHL